MTTTAKCGKSPANVKGHFPDAVMVGSSYLDSMVENPDKRLIDKIDARLGATGLSDRRASLMASGTPDMIRDIRRGRTPGAERLAKLADALRTTSDYLLGREEFAPVQVNVSAPAAEYAPPNPAMLPRDLPLYGTALGADVKFHSIGAADDAAAVEQTVVDMTTPSDFIRRPPRLAENRKAYALIVVGESMSPRFRDGETIIVDPKRTASIGDEVVIQLVNDGEFDDDRVVSALVKTLVRRTAQYIEVEQYSPAVKFRIPANRVKSLQRVAPWSELMSP
jgi:phage repressor protein C with HTH and peptisase S24 domain